MVVKFQVFKKNSPNGKITIFLPQRDFLETPSHMEPIEGVLLVDPNYVGERKVFVQLAMIFRYGSEEEEMMGTSFKRSLYIDTHQVYPPDEVINPSDVQVSLTSKLGSFAYPFILDLPRTAGPSYSMQRGLMQDGAVMGMEYYVMAFVGQTDMDIRARSSCKLAIRKIQEIPKSLSQGKTPKETYTKTVLNGMLTGIGSVTLECTLDRPVFGHDEIIPVVVTIENNTQKQVKRLKVKLVQKLECPSFKNTPVRARTISKIEDKILVDVGSKSSRNIQLLVSPPPKPDIGDILLQGQYDSNAKDILASSTIFNKDYNKDDIFGISVSYAIRVKAYIGGLQGDVKIEVPFIVKS